MKSTVIFFASLVLSLSSFAGTLTHKEYKALSLQQKVEVVKAYRDFFRGLDQSKLAPEEKVSLLRSFSLISEAFAEGEVSFECFYAGWPSKRIGGKCTNPSRGNPGYSAGSCSAGQLHCQPLLFGEGLCVPVGTQAQRNRAFSSCESQFSADGERSVQKVAESISQNPIAFVELSSTVETVCQSTSRICERVKSRVAAIREAGQGPATASADSSAPAARAEGEAVAGGEVEMEGPEGEAAAPQPATADSEQEVLRNVGEMAGQINTVVGSASQVNCAPETVTTLNRAVQAPDNNVKVIVCRPPENDTHNHTDEDYSNIVRDFNITFTHPELIRTPHFHSFMHELQKFPAPLLREMADVGGEIRLIQGTAVTSDPRWEQDRARLARIHANDNRPDTIQERRHAHNITTEGRRTWDQVSGAGGVFQDPNFIQPTRLVLNELYKDGALDQGSVNLFLHEHGHALDNLYGEKAVSNSPQWQSAMNDARSQAYIRKIFSTYENDGMEGFAELFAYYHSCAASRLQMEQQAPALAQFFAGFTSVRALRPDLYERWSNVPQFREGIARVRQQRQNIRAAALPDLRRAVAGQQPSGAGARLNAAGASRQPNASGAVVQPAPEAADADTAVAEEPASAPRRVSRPAARSSRSAVRAPQRRRTSARRTSRAETEGQRLIIDATTLRPMSEAEKRQAETRSAFNHPLTRSPLLESLRARTPAQLLQDSNDRNNRALFYRQNPRAPRNLPQSTVNFYINSRLPYAEARNPR